jgi:hypothetical protein
VVGNNGAAVAAQKEAIRPDLPQLFLTSSIFWGRTEVATDVTPVSTRPTRVPTLQSPGGQFSVGGFDGQNLGRGSGPQEIPAYASVASYLQASEWTLEADWGTDSSQKAIQNYVTLTHEMGFKTFGGYMDVCAQMDGSNTIDSIVSVATGALVVNTANKFQNGQLVDVWTAIGGAYVATLQITSAAINTNTLWMTTGIPGGVTAGMLLLVHGASGQANSGMLGLLYFDTQLDVGNYLGIPRASYPSQYIANGINLNNASLTPSVIRALQVLAVLAIGDQATDSEPVVHCGPDMVMAWEANYLGMQTATRNETKDTAMDMLPKNHITQIAGREILGNFGNPRATPGRLDFIDMKDWQRLEVKPADYIEFGGQTEFPVVGTDGGLASATLFYIGILSQLICRNPRRQCFVSNAAVGKYIYNR